MLIVSLLFLVAQIPTAKVEPKNLPIALVNEDSGEMGDTLTEKLTANAPNAIKFIEYDSTKAMKAGMNDRKAYGGIVIPKDFSKTLASLQTDKPKAATLKLFINEGMNTTAATSVEAMLKQISSQLNANVSAQMLSKMQDATDTMSKEVSAQLEQMIKMQTQAAQAQAAQSGQQAPTNDAGAQLAKLSTLISPVQPEKVTLLANPIETKVTKVNKAGDLASVPSAVFVAVWISSLLGALMFYFAGNKREFTSRKELTIFQVIQSLLPIIYGFFTGYVATWYSTWILDYQFDSFHTVALFISIAVIAYVYMMLATVSWLKTPSVAIFGLLIFFGLPLIQLAPEMIPDFYRDYVLPWLPMRFLIEGLKDILFFGKDWMNHYTNILLGIGGVSLIILWMKNILKKPAK